MRITWKGCRRMRMWKPSLPQVFTMYLLAQMRAASRAAVVEEEQKKEWSQHHSRTQGLKTFHGFHESNRRPQFYFVVVQFKVVQQVGKYIHYTFHATSICQNRKVAAFTMDIILNWCKIKNKIIKLLPLHIFKQVLEHMNIWWRQWPSYPQRTAAHTHQTPCGHRGETRPPSPSSCPGQRSWSWDLKKIKMSWKPLLSRRLLLNQKTARVCSK